MHGSVEATGDDISPAISYNAILELNQQLDYYNRGGLDVCFLGMGKVTAVGDVAVTRVGKSIKGLGSFINVSQSTKRVRGDEGGACFFDALLLNETP